jgi:hypothetical protein
MHCPAQTNPSSRLKDKGYQARHDSRVASATLPKFSIPILTRRERGREREKERVLAGNITSLSPPG